jgi:hypothetical protein
MDWIFSGIGTFLVGLIFGGASGFTIGRITIKKSAKQNQKAGNNATQTQSINQ